MPAAERARALLSVAFLAYFESSYGEATDSAHRAFAAYRELADAQGTARSQRLLGSIACERGEYGRSMAWYAEVLATYELVDDEQGWADVVRMTGFASWPAGDLAGAKPYEGDLTRARVLAGQALSHFVELDFREGIAWTHHILGLIALREGADAVPALRAGLRVHWEVGDRCRHRSNRGCIRPEKRCPNGFRRPSVTP